MKHVGNIYSKVMKFCKNDLRTKVMCKVISQGKK